MTFAFVKNDFTSSVVALKSSEITINEVVSSIPNPV